MPNLQLRDCFIQRVLARRVVHPDLESSLCSISHEDLASQNIIVDRDYNIKEYIFLPGRIHPPPHIAIQCCLIVVYIYTG
jgi:hypothetical protein